MVPFCITPEQNGSLLYKIGTKRFRFMASETKGPVIIYRLGGGGSGGFRGDQMVI